MTDADPAHLAVVVQGEAHGHGDLAPAAGTPALPGSASSQYSALSAMRQQSRSRYRSAARSPRCHRPGPGRRGRCSGRTPTRRPGRLAASGQPYGRSVLAAELATLGRATPGHRNRTLNRTAFKVYRYVGGGVLDEQDVTLAFTTAALAIGLDRAEIGRTLASARTAGLANPRTVPAAPGPSTAEDGS
jgi:hypothetical protein